jgi:hypothetical protein
MSVSIADLERVKSLKKTVVKALFDKIIEMSLDGRCSELDHDIAFDRAQCVKDELDKFEEVLEDYLENGKASPVDLTHFLSVYEIDEAQELTGIVFRYTDIGVLV